MLPTRLTTGHARTLTGVALASLATAGAVELQAASTALAASPPTISSAFTPTLIGVGGTTASALSVTITNPNSSGSLSSIGFNDTLPAGLTVDDPNGENGTCGSASSVTATPGGSSVSLSGGSLSPGASCTVSVSVVAAQPGVVQNDTGPVSSSAGSSSSGSTATLTILPAPVVSFTGVRNNARYAYGAVVRPRFSCAQPGDPAALGDCSAADDLGNTIVSGHRLNTRSPGSHSLTISASSLDGLVTTQTVNYTVLPDNRFTISHLSSANGTVSFRLKLPGPGTVVVRARVGHTTYGSYRRVVETRRTITVHLGPTPAAQALLAAGGVSRISLAVAYTPKRGVKRTVSRGAVPVH